ncbi:MAG: hypothetical protein PHD97_07345 [Bacteroidales bacterium]|nr:hypothetical protein [Bacteroidales bacterium]
MKTTISAILFLAIIFVFKNLGSEEFKKNNAKDDDKISKDCKYKGLKLYGKIKFVTSFPDIKVQVVESFPDLKVKIVDAFPDDCGKWQIVDAFPDLKVQIVESFPDIKIKFVESFPGKP